VWLCQGRSGMDVRVTGTKAVEMELHGGSPDRPGFIRAVLICIHTICMLFNCRQEGESKTLRPTGACRPLWADWTRSKRNSYCVSTVPLESVRPEPEREVPSSSMPAQ
jgi:hypothetical protein